MSECPDLLSAGCWRVARKVERYNSQECCRLPVRTGFSVCVASGDVFLIVATASARSDGHDGEGLNWLGLQLMLIREENRTVQSYFWKASRHIAVMSNL